MLWKMMATIALALAAQAMAGIAPAAAQDTAAKAAPTVAQFAEAMQHLTGQPDESGIVLESITAEDDILVFVFNGPDGWNEGLDARQVSEALVSGFCGEGAVFFDLGFKLRVDSIDRKVKAKGPVVTTCQK